MPKNEELLKRRESVVCQGVPRVTNITASCAKDAEIIDLEGRKYIDFAGGIGVINIGHCPEKVVAAIEKQASKLLHSSFHITTYEPYVELCEKLVNLLPHSKKTKALLLNSGAEAVENAIKIARQATNREAVICYTGGFHGRTLLTMTLTSKVSYKAGCGPFAPEIYRLPFPDYYHYGQGLKLADFVNRELERLQNAFIDLVPAKQIAAILIEPIQGEGGFIPAPFSYLQGLREICSKHGIILIFDEVQSGFCRTGKWAAYEHAAVIPDLSTWAKSMGGGMPISAVIGKAEVMDKVSPGTLGGTYGGNPVACAAALATINHMEELNLNLRAEQIGKRIRDSFLKLQEECSLVGDVRGLGAMMALELVIDNNPTKPAKDETTSVIKACAEEGLLIIPSGLHGNVIRILCPLVINDQQLDQGLEIITRQIKNLSRSRTSTQQI